MMMMLAYVNNDGRLLCTVQLLGRLPAIRPVWQYTMIYMTMNNVVIDPNMTIYRFYRMRHNAIKCLSVCLFMNTCRGGLPCPFCEGHTRPIHIIHLIALANDDLNCCLSDVDSSYCVNRIALHIHCTSCALFAMRKQTIASNDP